MRWRRESLRGSVFGGDGFGAPGLHWPGVMIDSLVPPTVVLVAAAALVSARRKWLAAPPSRGVSVADVSVVLAIVTLAAVLELAMGRTPVYQHGPVRLWSGNVHSDQNSQQIADPYTLTHVSHGVALYALTRLALGPSRWWLRATVTVAIESAWEVLENTDLVIERYRAQTISLDYYGDSVLNSVCDVLACLIGFGLAARLPTRVTIIGVVVVEAVLAFWIHDNLTLNVLMLIRPVDAVRRWQQVVVPSGG
ncbi:MAG: hypothetical protein QOD06_432 [Candidatus Binatota bacterium]|nr:hypothetical protein [Candidatus Binatota bacterium]